jgi:hypothetical protein
VKKIANTFPAISCAAIAIITVTQTRKLQPIPLKKYAIEHFHHVLHLSSARIFSVLNRSDFDIFHIR